MRPQTFELSKKYGFSQITFFRKIQDTNIDYKSFLKLNLGIKIKMLEKKISTKKFKKSLPSFNFQKKKLKKYTSFDKDPSELLT